jgi:hypothetical protein
MEVVNQVSNDDQTKSKIVTLFIHYNQEDDLSKIFTVLNEFRASCGLKFSHHRGQIFVSVRSEFLNDLYKRQPFKSSKYSTKTTYECDEETGNRLTAQKDSFLRMSYDNSTSTATFQSRTPQRVHYQLVTRVFKATNTTFDNDKYVFVPSENQEHHQFQHQHQHQGRRYAGAAVGTFAKGTFGGGGGGGASAVAGTDVVDSTVGGAVAVDGVQRGRGGYKTRGRGKAATATDASWTKVERVKSTAGPRKPRTVEATS